MVAENYNFAILMGRRTNPDQFSLYITGNRYNLNPVQLPVLTEDWAGLDHPEVDERVATIHMTSSPKESSAKWGDL